MAIKKPKSKTRAGRKPTHSNANKRTKAVQKATDIVVDLHGPAIKELANR